MLRSRWATERTSNANMNHSSLISLLPGIENWPIMKGLGGALGSTEAERGPDADASTDAQQCQGSPVCHRVQFLGNGFEAKNVQEWKV